LYAENTRLSRPAAARTGWIVLAVALPLIHPHASILGAEKNRVYKIGTDNSFPYHLLDADGKVEGMTAEVIVEAARRSGVRLQWELRMEGPAKSLAAKSVDIWPLFAVQHQDIRSFISRRRT